MKDSPDLILKRDNSYLGCWSQLVAAAACVVRQRLLSEYFPCVKDVCHAVSENHDLHLCCVGKERFPKITIENLPPPSSLPTGCVAPRHSLLLLLLPLVVLPTLLPSPLQRLFKCVASHEATSQCEVGWWLDSWLFPHDFRIQHHGRTKLIICLDF